MWADRRILDLLGITVDRSLELGALRLKLGVELLPASVEGIHLRLQCRRGSLACIAFATDAIEVDHGDLGARHLLGKHRSGKGGSRNGGGGNTSHH